MANLKHDASGFLTGDKIDLSSTMRVWGDIRRDVSAIKSAIIGASNKVGSNASKRNAEISRAEAAMPQGNRRASAVTAKAIQQAMSATGSKSNRASIAVSPTGRDNKGRFVKSGADSSDSDSGSANTSTLRGIADRIANAVSGASGSLDEVDPAAKAFSEVAQPMARGYSMLMGDSEDNKNERWYRRIYSTLAGFRKDESLFNKAANKSLKNLEDKEDGDGGSGSGGGFLSMLGRTPIIGGLLSGVGAKIASVFTKLNPFKLLSKSAGGAAGAGAAGVAGAGAKAAGKGLLKKIPLIGTLAALLFGAKESSDIESDASTTREQKNAKQGKNWGSVGGGLAGMAAGAAIGSVVPVVGTIIGGVVGAVVGEWLGGNAGEIIGENFSAIKTEIGAAWAGVTAAFMVISDAIGINWQPVGAFFTSVGEGISSAWVTSMAVFDSVIAGIGEAWGGFVDGAKKGWDAFTGLFSAAYEGLKKIPIIGDGIQAAEDAAKATAKKAKEVAEKAAAEAKVKYEETKAAVKEKAVAAKDAVVAGAEKAVVVGKNALSAGSRASEMYKAVSGYTKDPKEQAMLMANLDHETGGFKNYEEGLNYRSVDSIKKTFKGNKNLAGMSDADLQTLVKNPEKLANTVYANKNGNTEEGDGYKFRGRGGLQITGRSNYAELSKRMGLGTSLVDNPDQLANDPEMAAKASIEWLKMNKGRVNTALKNGDDIALRKVINGGKNGLDDVVAKTAAWNDKIAGGGVAVASAPASKVPVIAQPPVIADAAPVVTPMAYNDRQTNAVAQNKTADVSQDISDRRIAHVVTGGLSA